MENFKFCFPPINEQIEICNKLDKKIDLINTLTKKSKEKISLLKEYQQSLISSAVTGKIRITEDMI